MPDARPRATDRRDLLRALPVVAGALLLAQCGGGGPPEATSSPPSAATATSAGKPATERLTYGGDPSQFAELTKPSEAARGVVVLIHGGFWRAQYGLDLMRPLAAELAELGYAALNVEYRRVGPGPGPGAGGGFPATFDDVSAAIDLLASTDLDLAHVVAVGHSAGGHLAAWAAARQRFPRWTAARVKVTGVVSQAGVLDLTTADQEGLGGGAVAAFLGASSSDAAIYDQADPTRQLPLDVPVRCVHGRADDVVPVRQSEAYAKAARAAGAEATVSLVEGDHFAVIDPSGPAWRLQCTLLEELVR